jgi:glutamine amidotransferase
VTSAPKDVDKAEILILPGVGAFKDGMDGLSHLELVEPIIKKARSGCPLLAICLGMQMLFDESDEFGVTKGLGLIPGRVERIPDLNVRDERQRVPHVSWNGLYPPDIGFVDDPRSEGTEDNFGSTLLLGAQPGDEVYFIHSFEGKPVDNRHIAAVTYYGGRRICAIVSNDSVFGTQFHPEKSGAVGLNILKNFLSLHKSPS